MASSYQGFTVSQPFPGALLQFVPELGTPELDQLINQYIPGAQSMQEKRARVTIDFYEWSRLTGQTFRFYQVFGSPASSLAGSPTSPAIFTDSGYGSSIEPSPVIPSWDSPASFSSASTAPTVPHASRQRKPSRPSPRLTDFSDMPGMRIVTKDGVDVTNSASRGCKTKEQRDHAHMMRIMKACDSCKRRKIKCDPSHRSRPQAQAATQARTAALSRALAPTPVVVSQPSSQSAASTPAPAPPISPADNDWMFDFSLPADDQLAALMDEIPMHIPQTDLLQSIPDNYDFLSDPLGLLSGLDVTSVPVLPEASSSVAEVQNSETTAPALPYLQEVPTTDYTDFNLYSPASDTLDDELDFHTVSSRDSISPVDSVASQLPSPSPSQSASPGRSSPATLGTTLTGRRFPGGMLQSARVPVSQTVVPETTAEPQVLAVHSPRYRSQPLREQQSSRVLLASGSGAVAAPGALSAPSQSLSPQHISVSADNHSLHVAGTAVLGNTQSHGQATGHPRLRSSMAIESIPADNDGCTSRQAVPTNARGPQATSSPRSEVSHAPNHNALVSNAGPVSGVDNRPQGTMVSQTSVLGQPFTRNEVGGGLQSSATSVVCQVLGEGALQQRLASPTMVEHLREELFEGNHEQDRGVQDHHTRDQDGQVSTWHTNHTTTSAHIPADGPDALSAQALSHVEKSDLNRGKTITSGTKGLLKEVVQSIPISSDMGSESEVTSDWTRLLLSLVTMTLCMLLGMASMVAQVLVGKQDPILGHSLFSRVGDSGATASSRVSTGLSKATRTVEKSGRMPNGRMPSGRPIHTLTRSLRLIGCI